MPPSSLTNFEYFPPEKLIGGEIRCTPLSADMFSLGLIFLELVLGESLFDESRTVAQHIEVLLSIFGPSIITPFESQLKLTGLYPPQWAILKYGKNTLSHFLFKKVPK